MFIERRRQQRYTINRAARYYSGLGALPRFCTITDISESGARLFCDDNMPPDFTLTYEVDEKETRRECRIVWQLGGEYGVRFTDRMRL